MTDTKSSSPTKMLSPAAPRQPGGQQQGFKRRPLNWSLNLHAQSPLKCLNVTDPSPTKRISNATLRNPMQHGVKRRLNWSKSPTKKSRILEIDEDANLEPPRMKMARLHQRSPRKNMAGAAAAASSEPEACYRNDWTLRTKLRINFSKSCRNWHRSSSTIHMHRIYESPSKMGTDQTISIEAIKNVCTVYQHPFLAWRPLFPRIGQATDEKQERHFEFHKNPEAINMMHKIWCESLSDLANLLILGKCPYFYLCSDYYTILFKQIPSSNPKRPTVRAYISPLYYGMSDWLNKSGITYNVLKSEQKLAESGNSQETFPTSKATQSIDSGHMSDLSDDEFGEDENDTSTFLESIGIQDLPNFKSRQKGFLNDTGSQTKTTTVKQLAMIEGTENISKLVNFLQANRKHTTSESGRTAGIPPTLLAPCEFRLGTPQYPEVILQNEIVECSTNTQSSSVLSQSSESKSCDSLERQGPNSILLKGTILPNIHKELHKLLTNSDNLKHTCKATVVEDSIPFGDIQFTL